MVLDPSANNKSNSQLPPPWPLQPFGLGNSGANGAAPQADQPTPTAPRPPPRVSRRQISLPRRPAIRKSTIRKTMILRLRIADNMVVDQARE